MEEAVSAHTTRIGQDQVLSNHLLQASSEKTLHPVIENIYEYQTRSRLACAKKPASLEFLARGGVWGQIG